MILFATPSFAYLGRSLWKNKNIKRGVWSASRFPNQEWRISVQNYVRGERCLVLGGSAPPDNELFTLLILIHTLKKEGALSVIAVLPYLGYSRHDKNKRGEDLAIAWLGAMLKAAGAARVVTLDVHSELDKKLFPLPLTSLPVSALFAPLIVKLKNITLAAPDFGAIDNVEAMERAVGRKINKVYFKKERTRRGVILKAMRGRPTEEVILLDDILDTGGTLVQAARRLRRAGVKRITVMVTHGLFTGTNWQKLWALGVKRIYCTNSQPRARQWQSKKIKVLSIDDLLAKQVVSLARGVVIKG